jgi:hypothetical protein
VPITVDEVARAALSVVGSNAGLFLAIGWADERYRQLTSRVKMRHMRRLGEVVIPVPIDDGLATATRGSDAVTGDATATTAWAAFPEMKDGTWYFRGQRTWYRITDVTPAGALKLESEYAETGITAGGYKIIKRYHKLAPDVRFLGKFVHMRLHRPLRDVSMLNLDLDHPARWTTAGSGPEMVAEAFNDTEGHRMVEFYPYATQIEMVHYVYWPTPLKLRPGSILPAEVDVEALKSGVLIDVYRFEMAKAAREAKVESAALWRNEMRAQETTWERRIEEIAKADRGIDDVALILHPCGLPTWPTDDDPLIKTARADAVSRLTGWP